MTEPSAGLVKSRRVIHFAGFEPLDFEEHRQRYERAIAKSAQTFGFEAEVGATEIQSLTPVFEVNASGPNWHTRTHVTVLEHSEVIKAKMRRPLWRILLGGYSSAFLVVVYGGLFSYLKSAWRFALFFIFPFLLMGVGIFGAVLVSACPMLLEQSVVHLGWSVPLAAMLFWFAFIPLAQKLHTILLFSNWHVAVDMATGRNPDLNLVIKRFASAFAQCLEKPADEYLITSHSMGGAMMIHAIGSLLADNPTAFDGKRIVICSMGGAGLQCTLLRPASALRVESGNILRHPSVFWFDVQSLTDVVNFYTARGRQFYAFNDKGEPATVQIRMKHMLSAETYRRIKTDLLRVHRQFVLGSERRSKFDYSLMTAGPFPARQFSTFTNKTLPPLGLDGTALV